MNHQTKVGLVDDHVLLRKGLAGLIADLDFDVVTEASNGMELREKLNPENLPDVVLMDINMPVMDGFESTLWLRRNYASVKVLALSMYDDEQAIIRMIKNGAKGYILKDIYPQDLKTAIETVVAKGFFYSEIVTGRLVRTILDFDEENNKMVLRLSEREVQFLKLACTELTYKEIADQMHLSPRTIDGYRDALFEKLNVKSRVGLVLFAIKNGIVQLN